MLAMIDDGELDWKVIAINAEDPLAAELNDISDVDAKLPGVVSGTDRLCLIALTSCSNYCNE